MARSSSDPYWQAKVRFESSQTPAAAAIIEDKCLSCHVPMQHYPLRVSDAEMRFDDFNDVGLEGVSCTTCHQIIGENLGTHQSFTGGFEISSEGLIFGPHADPFPMPMLHHTGFTPAEGPHILESSLCGTCHTVITPTLDERGRIRGEFLEQAPYLEWLASSLPAEGRSCQSCHLPVLRDPSGRPAPQFIAHTPGGGFFGPPGRECPSGSTFLQAQTRRS